MSRASSRLVAALVLALGLGEARLGGTGAAEAPATQASAGQPQAASAEPAVTFTREFLASPENIETGLQLFQSRCKFCHGKTAYPGKAPKLEPFRYTPEFVYDRITNGFRGMPSWRHEFDERQRMQIAAYVMSPDFSN